MVSATTNGHANGYSNGHINGHVNGSNGSHAIPIVDPTAARRPTDLVTVESPAVEYDETTIRAEYTRYSSSVEQSNGRYTVRPTATKYEFKTQRKVPKTGLMLVGLGGNNGSTLVASILANKHNISWNTRNGVQTPNFYGSLVRASTVRLGEDSTTGKDVHVPLADVLPTVHPCDLVLGGWDISGLPLDKAMRRAKVVDYDLQRQVAPLMADMVPLPSIYYDSWIAANQDERADNLMQVGDHKQAHLERIRADIREFKTDNGLDRVIVLWTANTERYADLGEFNDTAEHLLQSINNDHPEVSPSTLFATASILEGAVYINGAPQNTFVPGLIDLAEQHKAFIGGDDFKSGQTKFKSVIAEFLVNAGIKPLSIASYNHLGNNDGMNLKSQAQFRSKEISKSSVVDDMVQANHLLYKPILEAPGGEKAVAKGEKQRKTEHPDHLVVIKYMPSVGDDKRAIDEYFSELMCGAKSTISTFNSPSLEDAAIPLTFPVCADSFLAVPLIIDLVLLAELLTRVEYKQDGQAEYSKLYSVLSLLSYMCKAPLGTDVVNGLSRQRAAIEHFLRALVGLQPLSEVDPAKLFPTVSVGC